MAVYQQSFYAMIFKFTIILISSPVKNQLTL